MKIVIVGASGFIGKYLKSYWEPKHEVLTLSSRRGRKPSEDLTNVDLLVNLAGENILGRWTASKKKKIYESRIQTTSFLKKIFESNPPKLWINASAIGFYPFSDQVLDEKASPGKGFLSQTCLDWEKEALSFTQTRVITTRFGVVLDQSGGMLKKMLPSFRCFLGAILGSGNQMMSWIALQEIGPIFDFLMQNTQIKGPVNLTAPDSVSNARFSMSLAFWLHVKVWLKIPKFLLKSVLGEASSILLDSHHIKPSVLEENGYQFRYPQIDVFFEKTFDSKSR